MRSSISGGRGGGIVVYAIAGVLGAFSDPGNENSHLHGVGKGL